MNNKDQKENTTQPTANPSTMAASDEAQRTQQNDSQQQRDTPSGNERESTPTEGAEAGMGE